MLETEQIITLLQLRGVGRRTVHKVLQSSSGKPTSLQQLFDLLLRNQVREENRLNLTLGDLQHASVEASKTIQLVRNLGIETANWGDEAFPERLWSIADPPVLLYYKGSPVPLLSTSSVAIVGTRQPTEFGRSFAEKLGSLFAKLGFVVVSGLALGCDTAAHYGCLKNNGKTVAVLAHGLDEVHPPSNRPLADKILRKGGCLVSEYAPGTKPLRHYFVQRDRLQSGLSTAVVVVETSTEGGAMHTVRYATQQRRSVGCLVPPPELWGNQSYSGNRKLIERQIAIPLESEQSIVDFVESLRVVPSGTPASRPARKRSTERQREITGWFR